MKRLFIEILIIIMAVTLTSCGDSNKKYIEEEKNNEVESAKADDEIIIGTEKHNDDENNNVQVPEEKRDDNTDEENLQKDNEVENTESALNDSDGAGGDISVSISEERAVELVKKYMSDNGEYIPSVVIVDNEDDSQYIIHAYDIIDDGNGTSHTATSGWYYVDKTTGEVVSMF